MLAAHDQPKAFSCLFELDPLVVLIEYILPPNSQKVELLCFLEQNSILHSPVE